MMVNLFIYTILLKNASHLFIFNSGESLSNKGTQIGFPLSPVVAYIFMASFEMVELESFLYKMLISIYR